MTRQWLSLTDYASKYRVSVSTLRRRIKAGAIPYRLEGGRYVIPNEEVSPIDTELLPQVETKAAMAMPLKNEVEAEGPILSSVSRILNELKRAYTSILQEKEEQIVQLKKEVSDLQTLVRVLEDDNERMNRLLR